MTILARQLKSTGFAPPARSILQHKVACGNFTSSGGAYAKGARNRGVIQRKLAVGATNDPLEREADRIADQVTAAHNAHAASIRVQRSAGAPAQSLDAAPPSVERTLASPGRALEPSLQQEMSARFGHDFSRVRVHTDDAATHSAHEVNAHAYTVGSDVVFAAGHYAPHTQAGRRLLAHELAHVVQQESGMAQGVAQRQGTGESDAAARPNLMKIYSFGPSGAGRVARASGTQIFDPRAPVDAQGRELVRAGTTSEPKHSRLGRYFTLDDRHNGYPPPIPAMYVKSVLEWTPDDGSAQSKEVKTDDAPKYYAPGEPLGTSLEERITFVNDRPGVLSLAYIFSTETFGMLLLGHDIHFVNDPSAPLGSTIEPPRPRGQGASAGVTTPGKTEGGPSASGGQGKGTPMPNSPARPATKAAVDATTGEIALLTEAIKRTSDAVKKDKLVKSLRDAFAKVQPFMPEGDAKKMIDEAIDSLVKEGADAAIKALVEAIVGKSGSTMPEDRNQIGPGTPEIDRNERIFKGPKITIPDTPKPRERTSFEYRNGFRRRYQAGETMRFTLITPPYLQSQQGGKRLVIVAASEKDLPSADRLARQTIDPSGTTAVEMQAPTKPGKYVLRVDVGLSYDYSSIEEFEVVPAEKK